MEKSLEILAPLKVKLPSYGKVIWQNFEDTIKKCNNLEPNYIWAILLSASYASRCKCLVETIRTSNVLSKDEIERALEAAAFMGVTNVFYPYTEMAGKKYNEEPFTSANEELNALARSLSGKYKGDDARQFEICELAASVIGKCDLCVKYHWKNLKDHHGVTEMQLCNVGRICAAVTGVILALATA